jgi:hypothetical protein
MKFIECKAQWLVRPMTTKASMDGFEGPAKTTEVDDGFGNVMVRGQRTSAFNCFFEQTGEDGNHNPIYDGTIRIPDCSFNREKIAAHIRSRDLRVTDRTLERQILADNAPGGRARREAAVNNTPEMPDDFDGTKIVLRSQAVRDMDPIEDPHAADVTDAEFTDVPVPEADDSEAEADDSEAEAPRNPSAAEVKAAAVISPAVTPPRGTDPRAKPNRVKANVTIQDLVPDVTDEAPKAQE